MSMPIGHFAFGASCALILIQAVPQPVRRKLFVDYGSVAILSGLWAMFPDAANFLSWLKPYHKSLWANLSFFHQLLDRLDANDSLWVSGGLLALMIVLIGALWVNELLWRNTK